MARQPGVENVRVAITAPDGGRVSGRQRDSRNDSSMSFMTEASTSFVAGDDDQSIFASEVAMSVTSATSTTLRRLCTPRPDAQLPQHGGDRADRGAFAAAELGATRLAKIHRTTADGPRDYRVLWFPNRPSEAAWVADRIERLLGTRYCRWPMVPCGVTARRVNPVALHPIAEETKNHGIVPYSRARRREGGAVSRSVLRPALDLDGQYRSFGTHSNCCATRNPTRDEARSLFRQARSCQDFLTLFRGFRRVLTEWGTDPHASRLAPAQRCTRSDCFKTC